MPTVRDYCPDLKEFGKHLEGHSGSYQDEFLNLVAACANYGASMHIEKQKKGLLAVMAEPAVLEDPKNIDHYDDDVSDPHEDFVREFSIGLLKDPAMIREFLYRLGDMDVDGAVLINRQGDLIGIGAYVATNMSEYRNTPEYQTFKNQLVAARRIKGNGQPGTKHMSALDLITRTAKNEIPVEAVVTSEGEHHTTTPMSRGIVYDLVFDPITGLFGQDLVDYRCRHYGVPNIESRNPDKSHPSAKSTVATSQSVAAN